MILTFVWQAMLLLLSIKKQKQQKNRPKKSATKRCESGEGTGIGRGRGKGIPVRNLRATRQGAKGFRFSFGCAFGLCMGNEAERGVG